jgi:glycerol-3-phosphate dehydrogenase
MAERDAEVDLLIIGGGISGAGIAQDAAARGLRTALVEQGDFAAGTSSKSSKLVHGGLRYLEHFSLGLMRESISERHTLARLAPGLVRWMPFLLPHYAGRTNRWLYSTGLWLYDHLARTVRERRHRLLNVAETLQRLPGLRSEGLTGGALFYDCVTDDARLVLSLVLDAQSRGARISNYVAAEKLIYESGRAAGAQVHDVLTGESWLIPARQVVLAAGPWTDVTLDRLGESSSSDRIRPAKGVHIVLPRQRIALTETILIPSASDRRFLFVIPWYEGIVVGTTDTDYSGDPAQVRPDAADVKYILDALHWSFPESRIGVEDIVSSYAGIRPLINRPGRNTADVPREYRVFNTASGLICVAGGKLTTYRLMARQVVNRVVRLLKTQTRGFILMPCWTHRIPLGNPYAEALKVSGAIVLPEDVREHLVDDYGMWARQILSIIEVHPDWSRRIAEGLPYILAEAYFAATREKARTLEDVLARRTRVALLDPARGEEKLRLVSAIVAGALNWSQKETERQVEHYREAIRQKYPGRQDLR